MKYILNYKEGSPIAKIRGGIKDKDVIFILDEDDERFKNHDNTNLSDDEKTNILALNFFRMMKGRMNSKELNKLQSCLIKEKKPLAKMEKMNEFYENGLDLLKERTNKEIILKDGKLYPLFNIDKDREVFYIAGMSGSGKSTYISYLMKAYKLTFPKNRIYLFSEKEEDPAFKDNFFTRVKINEDILKYPFKLEDFRNSFVVFDDYEDGIDKAVSNELKRLSKYVMNKGRSNKINMAYVSHLANDYKNTRDILNEMTSCTIFPFTTSQHSLKYLLERYFGFDKEIIKKINNLPSRWVTIYKVPLLIMYDQGCYLVK